MSKIDLQLGGGYKYQWECSIWIALTYFFENLLDYSDSFHDLVTKFLGNLEKLQLEGGETGKDLGYSEEELKKDRELEDINLFSGDKRILIQVKTKEKDGSLWKPSDPLLNKALNKFYERHIQETKPQNTRYVFLTNRDFNDQLQSLIENIQKGSLSQYQDQDKLTVAGNLHKSLCAYLKREKKEQKVDFKLFSEILAQTTFVYYQKVEDVETNIQLKLQALGRKDDYKQAYALLFTHFAKQSTRKGGGIITPSFLQEVLGVQQTLSETTGDTKAAAPFTAPNLPEQFVPRPEVVDWYKQRLQTIRPSSGVLPISGIHAMGGSGKTITAAYLAHEFRDEFVDGVLWVELKRDTNLQEQLDQLYSWIHELNPIEPRPGSEKDATDKLRSLLIDKSCLLIIDNVWDVAHAKPFIVGGPKCHVLITCRRKIKAKDFNPRYFELPDLSLIQALELLEKHLGREIEEVERKEAEELAEAVGYHPLALTLVAARVADGRKSWADFYQPLKGLESKRRNVEQRKENQLKIVLNMSLVILREEDVQEWEAFVWLGILPRGVHFAAPMCATLWMVDPDEAEEILSDIENDALLRQITHIKVGDKQWPAYQIHDLLYDLAIELLELPEVPLELDKQPGLGLSLVEAHGKFLEKYQGLLKDGKWHTIADDGYIYAHLAWHMREAGRKPELYQLISKEWKDAKFARYFNHQFFSQDVDLAVQVADEESNLPELVRLCLLYATLGELASNAPPDVLGLLARFGQVETALGYAALSLEPGRCCDAYRLIGEELLATGDLPRAKLVLQQAVGMAEEHPDDCYEPLSEVARVLAQAGDGAGALAAVGIIRYEYFKVRALNWIAVVTARAGDQDGAFEIARQALQATEKIEDEISKVRCICNVAQTLTKSVLQRMHW